MLTFRKVVRDVVVVLLVGVCAGCAETSAQRANRIEPMLLQAGFTSVPADTPARVAKLNDLTALKVKHSTHNGKSVYWFADPYACHCLFRGSEQNYQQYRALSHDVELAQEMDNYELQQSYETYMGGAADQVFYGQ